MASVIDVDPPGEGQDGFATDHAVWSLGNTVLTRATLPGGHKRRFRHLRKEPLDHWCLVLCQPSGLDGAGRAPPGRLTSRLMGIRSLGRPFETEVDDSSVLSLYIPRDLAPAIAATLDGIDGDIEMSGLATLLADYLVALERRLPVMTAEETERIAEATGNIIAACLAPNADRLEAAGPALNWTLLERARRAIQQHLSRPDFSPDELCRMIGASRSRLYRVFEPLGGVSHYVQRQRLRQARIMLATSRPAISISRISELVGFSDLSSFSRAFRREYGASPRDLRGVPIGADSLIRAQEALRDVEPTHVLERALRSLRG